MKKRKIYLASQSIPRKNLLKRLGLEFTVIPTHITEKTGRGGYSFPELVKHNALLKAKSASEKVKSGIIIAADTITVQDGRIFGKPRNLKDARRMLKKISSRPQVVYSGIAVIDKENNKIRLGCEKTTVYMDRLRERQIDDYFRKVSPLDKAGSFDIQGWGAVFIRRIDGCYYNVVGLPLRRLYLVLERMKLKIFMPFFLAINFSLCLALSGCSTEYNIVTGEEEMYYYSTDREVRLGQAIAKEVEKEYKLADDPIYQKRVEDIGRKIAAVSDRKEIDYTFKVLEDDEVNAVSLPGGFVYINKGLIEKASSDDELACVIAHEVGHIVARHSIKKLQALQGFSLFRILVSQAPDSGKIGAASDALFVELLLGYSREDELLADQLGARYASLAGYDPRGMIRFLEKLQDIYRRQPLRPKSYFKTHPYVPDRIRTVKQEIGEKIDFTDYINIEQKPHE